MMCFLILTSGQPRSRETSVHGGLLQKMAVEDDRKDILATKASTVA